ncbi:hypothetical protein BJV78DRAFT_800392 [Lactifluus subvellereus]|nr:hypothetical protein BJV78DRAFT_800392 [Lactifluus subvellereus]
MVVGLGHTSVGGRIHGGRKADSDNDVGRRVHRRAAQLTAHARGIYLLLKMEKPGKWFVIRAQLDRKDVNMDDDWRACVRVARWERWAVNVESRLLHRLVPRLRPLRVAVEPRDRLGEGLRKHTWRFSQPRGYGNSGSCRGKYFPRACKS